MTEAILNGYTGELVDADDEKAVEAALTEVEGFINGVVYGKNRAAFQTRDALRARLAELQPITLPRRSQQTEKQRKVMTCPRCKHVIESGAAAGPQRSAPEDGPSSGLSPGSGRSDAVGASESPKAAA